MVEHITIEHIINNHLDGKIYGQAKEKYIATFHDLKVKYVSDLNDVINRNDNDSKRIYEMPKDFIALLIGIQCKCFKILYDTLDAIGRKEKYEDYISLIISEYEKYRNDKEQSLICRFYESLSIIEKDNLYEKIRQYYYETHKITFTFINKLIIALHNPNIDFYHDRNIKAISKIMSLKSEYKSELKKHDIENCIDFFIIDCTQQFANNIPIGANQSLSDYWGQKPHDIISVIKQDGYQKLLLSAKLLIKDFRLFDVNKISDYCKKKPNLLDIQQYANICEYLRQANPKLMYPVYHEISPQISWNSMFKYFIKDIINEDDLNNPWLPENKKIQLNCSNILYSADYINSSLESNIYYIAQLNYPNFFTRKALYLIKRMLPITELCKSVADEFGKISPSLRENINTVVIISQLILHATSEIKPNVIRLISKYMPIPLIYNNICNNKEEFHCLIDSFILCTGLPLVLSIEHSKKGRIEGKTHSINILFNSAFLESNHSYLYDKIVSVQVMKHFDNMFALLDVHGSLNNEIINALVSICDVVLVHVKAKEDILDFHKTYNKPNAIYIRRDFGEYQTKNENDNYYDVKMNVQDVGLEELAGAIKVISLPNISDLASINSKMVYHIRNIVFKCFPIISTKNYIPKLKAVLTKLQSINLIGLDKKMVSAFLDSITNMVVFSENYEIYHHNGSLEDIVNVNSAYNELYNKKKNFIIQETIECMCFKEQIKELTAKLINVIKGIKKETIELLNQFLSIISNNFNLYLFNQFLKLSNIKSKIMSNKFSIDNIWKTIKIIDRFKSSNPQYDSDKSLYAYSNFIKLCEPFEIMDGDNFIYPKKILQKCICGNLKEYCNKPIIVISIFGPQSSGKSTVLNALFGCELLTGGGKVSQGIFGTLIVYKAMKYNILLLDSEGLESVENKKGNNYDKKIAMFCLLISHVVILNAESELKSGFEEHLKLCAQILTEISKNKIAVPKLHIILNKCLNKTNDNVIKKSVSDLIDNLKNYQSIAIDSDDISVLHNAFRDENDLIYNYATQETTDKENLINKERNESHKAQLKEQLEKHKARNKKLTSNLYTYGQEYLKEIESLSLNKIEKCVDDIFQMQEKKNKAITLEKWLILASISFKVIKNFKYLTSFISIKEIEFRKLLKVKLSELWKEAKQKFNGLLNKFISTNTTDFKLNEVIELNYSNSKDEKSYIDFLNSGTKGNDDIKINLDQYKSYYANYMNSILNNALLYEPNLLTHFIEVNTINILQSQFVKESKDTIERVCKSIEATNIVSTKRIESCYHLYRFQSVYMTSCNDLLKFYEENKDKQFVLNKNHICYKIETFLKDFPKQKIQYIDIDKFKTTFTLEFDVKGNIEEKYLGIDLPYSDNSETKLIKLIIECTNWSEINKSLNDVITQFSNTGYNYESGYLYKLIQKIAEKYDYCLSQFGCELQMEGYKSFHYYAIIKSADTQFVYINLEKKRLSQCYFQIIDSRNTFTKSIQSKKDIKVNLSKIINLIFQELLYKGIGETFKANIEKQRGDLHSFILHCVEDRILNANQIDPQQAYLYIQHPFKFLEQEYLSYVKKILSGFQIEYINELTKINIEQIQKGLCSNEDYPYTHGIINNGIFKYVLTIDFDTLKSIINQNDINQIIISEATHCFDAFKKIDSIEAVNSLNQYIKYPIIEYHQIAIGCLNQCAFCQRQCCIYHTDFTEKHECSHFLRCFNGISINNKPSFFSCDLIYDDCKILYMNKLMLFSKIREKYCKSWNFNKKHNEYLLHNEEKLYTALRPILFEKYKMESNCTYKAKLNFHVVFICDCTLSMSPYINQSKIAIQKIYESYKQSKLINLQIAFVGYRDHGDKVHESNYPLCPPVRSYGPTNITSTTEKPKNYYYYGDWDGPVKSIDFSENDKIIKFIDDQISEFGGEDCHEAMIDGFNKGLELIKNVNSDVKIFIVIADEPPHGKEFGDYGDDYQNGCYCGLKWVDMYGLISKHMVKVVLLKACIKNNVNSNHLLETESEFKAHMGEQFYSYFLKSYEEVEQFVYEEISKNLVEI